MVSAPTTIKRWVLGVGGVGVLAVGAAAVVVGGSSTTASVAGEPVAASPADAAEVVAYLGRSAVTQIAASDPLIDGNPEVEYQGVDVARGVALRLSDGSKGWLVGGNGTVCLVLPALTGGAVTTNCSDASEARQHGVGRVTSRQDPADPKAEYRVDLVLPPGTATPYVTAKGSDAKMRSAQISDDGTVASATVTPSEDLVNPAGAPGAQRMFPQP